MYPKVWVLKKPPRPREASRLPYHKSMDLSKLDPSKAVSALLDKLQSWMNEVVLMLPNLLLAVVIIALAGLVAGILSRVAKNAMNKATSYTTLNQLVATVVRVAVIGIGLFVALGVLGLDKTVTSLLAGAGVVGLALAFAFQDIAGNFMSGVLLAVRRPFRVNDIIETNDFFGVVEELNLRSIILRSPQGQIIIIPNSSVLQNPIKNYSKTQKRRIDLSCGVAYGDDLEKAEKVALGALDALAFIDRDKPVELYYTEFGGSSIDFQLRFWIDFAKQVDFLKAQSEAIKSLKVAFDNAGITIPFPIRTLDFGVVGGVNLNEVMPEKFYQK